MKISRNFDRKSRKIAKKTQNFERHTTARASLALATLALARASRKNREISTENREKIAKNIAKTGKTRHMLGDLCGVLEVPDVGAEGEEADAVPPPSARGHHGFVRVPASAPSSRTRGIQRTVAGTPMLLAKIKKQRSLLHCAH